jgi:hypothetical protein
MGENVLLIAFDGLDRELIEEFDLENIQQKEFGGVNNTQDVENILTSELFTSLITGQSSDEHGLKGLSTWSNSRGNLIDYIAPKRLVNSVRGFNRIKEILKSVFSVREVKYSKEHLEDSTLFDKIEDSRAMYVPGYNPSLFWEMRAETLPLRSGYGAEKAIKFWDSREHDFRKRNMFSELENDIVSPRNFLMIHIHRADFHQHMYGDPTSVYDKERLKKLYREIDELAESIKSKAEDRYDTIIFMSDHGLPTKHGHNKNAFYSCNRELFKKEPTITDFYDEVLDLVGSTQSQ